MMKKIFLMACSVIIVILIANFLPQKLNDEISIPINEEIEYKIYGDESSKKEINEISYEDAKKIGITKNKLDKILAYKEYMGAIEKVDELKDISRFTEKDINTLKNYFVDSKNINYVSHNINNATEEQLRYLGLSKKSVKKIKEYGKLTNMVELKEIVGKDFKNIKSGVTF